MSLARIFTLLIIATSSLCSVEFLDITKYGYEQYQDIIINNEVIKPATNNHKDCDTRYQIIKKILDLYERPFTMLDIGASQGYYSFRTAYNYDCVCVMIEGDNPAYPMIGRQLIDLCTINNLDNIILLNKLIVPSDLQQLSKCEHFDVVLALNIIHWFGDKWKEVADAILNMGDNIIIETPPQETIASKSENDKRKSIEDYLISKNAQIIGTVPRHTSNSYSHVYLIEADKNYLENKTWFSKVNTKETHLISSNFVEKKLTKQIACPPYSWITTDWIPGINFLTFKMYSGAYPFINTVQESIKKISSIETNDWMPNNFILQGTKITMIDINDPNHNPDGKGGGKKFSLELFKKTLEFAALKEPSIIERFFWNTIVHNT